MSDLISTPSQTQSPVSNEAFEALIDLLATDGIDESPSRLPGRTQPKANLSLRDPSRKLDFDKIRLMFAESHRAEESVPREDGESDDERHSHRSAPSTVPSRSHSKSPKPVERPSAGHRRSSTFGNEPWAAIHGTSDKAEDAAPTLSRRPLSFDELNTALAGAQEEVRSLRQRYDELQALVAKRLAAEVRVRHQAKPCPIAVNGTKVAPDKENGHVEAHDAGAQARPGIILPPSPPPPPSDVPADIARLSEDEAKKALSALVRSLNLAPSALTNFSTPPASTSPQQTLSPVIPTRQHDVAAIMRALKFLGTVDELVWRRALGGSGPRTLLPVFSEENIVALVARLELWERAVRRSSRT